MKDQKPSRDIEAAQKRTTALLNKKGRGPSLDKDDALEEERKRRQYLLETAKDRFNKASDGWSQVRERALDDLKFYQGEQWSDNLKAVGRVTKEPILTVNRLPQFTAQVENELRRQQIAINVYPTDEVGSEETAEVFAGLIRDIERKSHAPSAYIHAAGSCGAMVPGFGFLKLTTVYADRGGFNQEIRIESPADPFKVLPDPEAQEPDSSDAQFWFEFTDLSQEAYKAQYPDSELISVDLTSPGSTLARWLGPNGIRVCKYWYKEEVEAIEYLLEDGTTIDSVGWYDPNADEVEQDDERSPFPTTEDEAGETHPLTILRTRTILDTKVKYCTFNGVEVLDEGEWADDKFPFVSIYGSSLIIDGKRDIHGIIRHAKDAQQMLNYMASSTVRRIGSANKAPWIVDARSIQKYEEMWKTANTQNWSALFYNSTNPDNPQQPLPAPMRADQTGQVTDLLAAAAKFENDLKATVGVYDAGLGATPNEQSGIAIKTLAEQGKNANFHFSDNLARGIQRLGHLLICLIPKVYDTPRAVRIIGADTTEKLVKINQVFYEGPEQKEHDFSKGNYGVAVAAGPAYATRKQQALDQITKLVAADPAIMPVIQDLLVGEMDIEAGPIIKERLRKLLALTHPQLVEADTGTSKLPVQAQAALAQQTQVIQALTQQLQQTQLQVQQLEIEKQLKVVEHQHAMALVLANRDADILLEQVKAERDIETVRSKAQLDAIAANADLEADTAKEYLKHQSKVQELVIQHVDPSSLKEL